MNNPDEARTIEEKRAYGIFKWIKDSALKRKSVERKYKEDYQLQLLAEKQKQADANRELIKDAEDAKKILNCRDYPGLLRFLDRCMAEMEELIKEIALSTNTPDEMKLQMRDIAANIRLLESIRSYPADVLNRYADLQKSLTGQK
jgi:hypothetical protein